MNSTSRYEEEICCIFRQIFWSFLFSLSSFVRFWSARETLVRTPMVSSFEQFMEPDDFKEPSEIGRLTYFKLTAHFAEFLSSSKFFASSAKLFDDLFWGMSFSSRERRRPSLRRGLP